MNPTRLAVVTALTAAAVTASIAPNAFAATQRYASPAGTGTACTAATPCSLTQAVAGATSYDEVIVSVGDYPLTATLSVPSHVAVRGAAGGARPRLQFSGANQAGVTQALDSSLRSVDIVQVEPSTRALMADAAVVDHVVVQGSAGASCIAGIHKGSTIRNSVVVAPGSGATAICTAAYGGAWTSTYRNVTAIATGANGVAVEAIAGGAATKTVVDLVNVIAKGGPLGASLSMGTDSSGASATITAGHTNWANYLTGGTGTHYVDLGGNQGTPPAFVDAAAGDYREAAGSVTIDAGLDSGFNGASDLDGDPRVLGTTDIGADEFVPAPGAPPAGTPQSPATTPSTTTRSTTAPTPPAQVFAGVGLVSSKLAYARKAIAVKLRCPAGTVGSCAGRIKLTARRVTLGRARFAIAPGAQAKAKVRVTRAGRKLLRAVPRVRARAGIAAHDGAGQSKTTRVAVTIRHR
jgi:hypothetical protein